MKKYLILLALPLMFVRCGNFSKPTLPQVQIIDSNHVVICACDTITLKEYQARQAAKQQLKTDSLK